MMGIGGGAGVSSTPLSHNDFQNMSDTEEDKNNSFNNNSEDESEITGYFYVD